MADFAGEVRRLMAEGGRSLRGLAREAGYDPSYLSKILSGRKPASPFLAKCLDDALGAGGLIEQAASRPGPAVTVPGEEFQGPVAPELADYFGSQLAGHYSADRFLGPTRLIPTAASQYKLLCVLANAASDSLRGDLWSLATGYAAFVGWLYQDAGDLGTSASWLDVMLERAHRSQDMQLVCFALHNKAMLQADMKDGRGVLDLTGAALQQRAHLRPKVQVLLLQQAAHGTSLVGCARNGPCRLAALIAAARHRQHVRRPGTRLMAPGRPSSARRADLHADGLLLAPRGGCGGQRPASQRGGAHSQRVQPSRGPER